MSSESQKVFGIDLGTTYSCIAYVDEHGKPVVVPNMASQRITPSVVFFDGDEIIVGNDAKESSKIQPDDVASFVKRSMGDPNFTFSHNGKNYTPEEISGYILRKLVEDARQYLDEDISDIVITCPAYFGINEREATRLAGEIAGLNVRRIINEPTSAAIAYGMTEEDKKVVLVYDLGGGTFDITMIAIKPDSIEVICTGGNKNLGGKDWDDAIVRYFVEQFQEETGIEDDILEDPETSQDVQLAAEKAKQTLTQREKAPVVLTYGGERVKIELTREKFEELTQALIEQTVTLTHEMLDEAGKKGYDSFDDILLVGGSTLMPQVNARLAEEFPNNIKIFDPHESVAKGAALFGWKLMINDDLIKRIADSTGQQVEDVKLEEVSEEVVEQAAQDVADRSGFTLDAVQSSVQKIMNVTSKSFGVVARNAKNERKVFNLIMKNTTVPVDITDRFGTSEAGQETVEVRIMESESGEEIIELDQAEEIGMAVLDIPSNLNLPAGAPIDITFKLNDEGRLEMTAIEPDSSTAVNAVIETSSVIQGEALEEAKDRCLRKNVS
ncbi:MAG: Hsp70 family protein [Candidatus Electryoneaceae bacterium]|nr:Hsp70 family protein [Candidatus Electryoneaceae bacterium]